MNPGSTRTPCPSPRGAAASHGEARASARSARPRAGSVRNNAAAGPRTVPPATGSLTSCIYVGSRPNRRDPGKTVTVLTVCRKPLAELRSRALEDPRQLGQDRVQPAHLPCGVFELVGGARRAVGQVP